MESLSRVTLQREGRRQELQLNQVTVENIRRLFQVDPADAWLKDEYDGISYFPNEDGNFDLSSSSINSFSTLIVEGPILSSRGSNLLRPSVTLSSTSTPPTMSYILPPPPPFCSVITPRRAQTFSLKVVRAKLTSGRKATFEPLSQMYIELVESTANLDYIHSILQRRWSAGYTIVTNGIELEDSPATQGFVIACQNIVIHLFIYTGLAFWKKDIRS